MPLNVPATLSERGLKLLDLARETLGPLVSLLNDFLDEYGGITKLELSKSVLEEKFSERLSALDLEGDQFLAEYDLLTAKVLDIKVKMMQARTVLIVIFIMIRCFAT